MVIMLLCALAAAAVAGAVRAEGQAEVQAEEEQGAEPQFIFGPATATELKPKHVFIEVAGDGAQGYSVATRYGGTVRLEKTRVAYGTAHFRTREKVALYLDGGSAEVAVYPAGWGQKAAPRVYKVRPSGDVVFIDLNRR